MPLQDAVTRWAKECPHKDVIRFEDSTWSYGELDTITDRMACRLLSIGLCPGDRVAFLFPNIPEIIFSYYACFKAGLTAVPLNPRMKGPEIAYVLNHSGACTLLCYAPLYAEIEAIRRDLPALQSVYLAGAEETGNHRFFTELSDETNIEMSLPPVSPDAAAVILYTSGTTARPKGVIHTHRSLEELVDSVESVHGKDDQTIHAVVPPLCHMGSLGGAMLNAINSGGTLLLLPRFDPAAFLGAIQTHRVTNFWLLPVLFNALLQVPNASSYDLSSVTTCLCAGDTMPDSLRERLRQIFGIDTIELCGMTEIIYSSNPRDNGNRPGSIGKPLPGVDIRLVDNEGNDVVPGAVGEILAQGAGMMQGYWGDPDATAEAMKGGWMHTGDLAWADEDGYYWFVGRTKDIIIRGGSNIAPAEVEEALCSHSAISLAGVIGVPDPVFGQAVQAFVTCKPGMAIDEIALQAYLKERLSDHKIPETIRIVDALPLGMTGKIRRQTLREWVATADPVLSSGKR